MDAHRNAVNWHFGCGLDAFANPAVLAGDGDAPEWVPCSSDAFNSVNSANGVTEMSQIAVVHTSLMWWQCLKMILSVPCSDFCSS